MMMIYNEENLNGIFPSMSAFPPMPADAAVNLNGVHIWKNNWNEYFEQDRTLRFNVQQLAKGVGVLGAPRTGKTNVIMEMTAQIMQQNRIHPENKTVVLDVKGEYRRGLADEHDAVIGIKEHRTKWNLFRDILAWGSDPDTVARRSAQLCEYLFADMRSEQAPYFVEAAKIIVSCIIEGMIRDADENGSTARLNNAVLRDFLYRANTEDYLNALNAYLDFHGTFSLLTESAEWTDHKWDYRVNKDGAGVHAEITVMARRFFRGAFGERGDFSIVEFLKQRQGGNLFLVSESADADVTFPVLRYLLDMAFDALGTGMAGGGSVTFVMDEFAQLRELKKLPVLMALLPGYQVCFIMGLQNTEQVRAVYGDAKARNLLDLFQTLICLNAPPATVHYLQERFGKIQIRRHLPSETGGIRTETQLCNAVEEAEVMTQDVGEAFIRLPDGYGFRFQFEKYN